MNLLQTPVLIVGLGKTGFDTARVLIDKGAEVRITEMKESPELKERKSILKQMGAKVETGGHTEAFFKNIRIVIPSPGVPLHAMPLVWAQRAKIPILSEIEIAWHLSPSKKIIAITGTNGKTTVTSLIGEIFRAANIPSVVCGNIGNTFIGEVPGLSKETVIILETSSFQLGFTEKFRPFVGILLNIAEDHLDYHRSFEEYINAKKHLFSAQLPGDWAILNANDPQCVALANQISSQIFFFAGKKNKSYSSLQTSYIHHDSIFIKKEEKITEYATCSTTKLYGRHNRENISAASAVSAIFKIPQEIFQRAIDTFQPLHHRFEKIAESRGISFINDSKATNVDAVKRALENFSDGKCVFLILGGKDKGISFSSLKELIERKVHTLFLIGENAERIRNDLREIGIKIQIIDDYAEGIKIVLKEGKKGDSLLLSPGSSSFDRFTNYQERGDVFTRTVHSLL